MFPVERVPRPRLLYLFPGRIRLMIRVSFSMFGLRETGSRILQDRTRFLDQRFSRAKSAIDRV
jgi:hypothetical protein